MTTTKPRQTRVQALKLQCGVYPIAVMLNRKGYSLQQAMTLLFPAPRMDFKTCQTMRRLDAELCKIW